MTTPILARYDFLSYLRRGAAASLTTPDPLTGPLAPRGALAVGVSVRSTDGGAARDDLATASVQLYGPGDITGIDPRHVIATEPRHGSSGFEPNYLAGIQFDHPDLPWIATPAAPAGERLRPWLCLLALAEGEFEDEPGARDPLPVVKVTDPAALPELDESWAWAHVQISGGLGAADPAALALSEPHRVLSRLLSPRRLRPRTRYAAVLVPAFDLGVTAGLGDPVPTGAGVQAQPAWAAGASNLRLPVYHRFEFETGEQGDFESLVRRLVPRRLPPEVGMRPMAVDQPGWGVRPAGEALGVGGALRSLETTETPWLEPQRTSFRTDLTALVDRAAAPLDDPAVDPVVVPPLYGRWHAARTTMDPAHSGWLDDLNADPRPRTMAGFGTRVVLDQRSQLMASAWRQVEGIDRANQLLRQVQLARGATLKVYEKHLKSVTEDVLLTLTAPLHQRLPASPRTVAATVGASTVPIRALSPTFRRVGRPRGPVRRRQRAAGRAVGSLLERLSAGALSPLPPLRPPGDMKSIDDLSAGVVPGWVPAGLRNVLRQLARLVLWLLRHLPPAIVAFGALVGAPAEALLVAALVAAGLLALLRLLRTLVRRLEAGALTQDALAPDAFTDAAPRPGFTITDPRAPRPPEDRPGRPGQSDSADARDFRAAGAAVAGVLALVDPRAPVRPALDIPAMSATVLERADPAVTLPVRVGTLVTVDPALATVVWEPEQLDEIMAAPEFPQPMYEPLRDLSQDLLLPGLERIEPNTLALLRENHAFIEAYMIGLNHELGRVLLYNGYPSDQRGSYFRQFWDVRGYVPLPSDPADPAALAELLKDIPEVHRWPQSRRLGDNRNRAAAPDRLILLVRGDLLRRYPNALVYACEALWDASTGKRVLGSTEKHPLYRGTLPPDITFFGFDLTEAQARGDQTDRTRPQGWFFVFQQQPTEPRFGFDTEPDPFTVPPAVSEWDDLGWANLTGTPAALDALEHAPAAGTLHNVAIVAGPDNPGDTANSWGADAAQTAFITMRRPARIAVHAVTMLPRQGA